MYTSSRPVLSSPHRMDLPQVGLLKVESTYVSVQWRQSRAFLLVTQNTWATVQGCQAQGGHLGHEGAPAGPQHLLHPGVPPDEVLYVLVPGAAGLGGDQTKPTFWRQASWVALRYLRMEEMTCS